MYTWVIIALLVAAVNWYAADQENKKLEYFTKPAVMVLLYIWLQSMGGGDEMPTRWFALGIVFSLAGDIFLMLPKEQFMAGLVSFLLAHAAYIVGFNAVPVDFNIASAFILVAVVVAAGGLYRRMSDGLVEKDMVKLRIPVLVYTIVISAMLVSALTTLTGDDWPAGPALLASGGALLFFVSDALQGWYRFVSPVPRHRLWIMMTYHLGQVGIIVGAAMFYLG